MDAVRRGDDGELCGYVAARDDHWVALTVFGAELGRRDQQEDAAALVLAEGLASLADRWTLLDTSTGDEEVVCIQEVSRDGVTVARGYSSMPGVPTLRIAQSQLDAGEWVLRR